MRNHDRRSWILVALVYCLTAGCATTNMPRNWLGDPKERSYDGYGGWIDVRVGERRISGELIAVTLDSLFVADTELHAIGSRDVTSAQLVMYSPANIASLVLAGTILTVSNGVYLVFTAPMWLIFGSTAAASRFSEALIQHPSHSILEMTRYARFPQGLPAGVDRTTIRTKPLAPLE